MSDPAFGTVPQWITALGFTSLLIAWWRRGVQLRGLDNANLADIRKHYATELGRLNNRIDIIGQQHDTCLEENARLRDRIRHVEDELTGVYRLIAQASQDKVLFLGDNVPEHIRAAAIRAGAAIDDKGRKSS